MVTLAGNERVAESVAEGVMSKMASMVEGVVPNTVSVVEGVMCRINELVSEV